MWTRFVQLRLTERQRTRSDSASGLQVPQLDSVMSSAAPSGSPICVVAFPDTPSPGAVRRTSQVPLGRFKVVSYAPDRSANFWLMSNLREWIPCRSSLILLGSRLQFRRTAVWRGTSDEGVCKSTEIASKF